MCREVRRVHRSTYPPKSGSGLNRISSHELALYHFMQRMALDGRLWCSHDTRGVSYEFTRSVRSARSLNVHHLRAHLARAVPPLETRFAGKRFANHVSYREHCFCKIRRIVGVARNLSQPVGERTI
jgi:hypothetical protein